MIKFCSTFLCETGYKWDRVPEGPCSVLDRFSSVEVLCVHWGLGMTVTACVWLSAFFSRAVICPLSSLADNLLNIDCFCCQMAWFMRIVGSGGSSYSGEPGSGYLAVSGS